MTAGTRTFFKTYLAIGIALSALALYQTELQTQAFLKIRTRYKWVVVMAVFAVNLVVGVYLLLRRAEDGRFRPGLEINLTRRIWMIPAVILLVSAFPALWFLKYDFFGKAVPDFFPLLWCFWWLALVQAVSLKTIGRLAWPASFALVLLLDGLVFQTYTVLQPVTDYPFSLGWSEASRFYYGSLPFSKSLYGVQLPLSVWHATRYFLLSIPFMIRNLPLWADRLWQSLLWLGLTGLASWLLVRRIRPQEKITGFLLGAWSFLYFFQGAVYYHLQVSVILILLGFSVRHPGRSLAAVILSSFWAGMSRLNWYPVPAMLAIGLYLLEQPFSRENRFWRYIAWPALWAVAGLVTALAGQAFYIAISGNTDLSAFESSLHSPLLFYRWWPSDTNALGIVPGILLVSLPLLLLVFQEYRGRWNDVHPVRWLGLLAMLLILFGGGLIVSSKIGGGGDLHNMDAYMVLLAVLAAYTFLQRIEVEKAIAPALEPVAWPGIALLLFIPVAFSLSRITPPIQYDRVQAARDLAALRDTVLSYSKSGEVLFIYERQLLTFDEIPNVPVVPQDEVVTLMEMAISDNRPYLDQFDQDLRTHRFAAIVARRQNLEASTTGDFPEEGRVWNRLVAYPLLCEYEPVLTLSSSNIQVLIPRPTPECPVMPGAPVQP